LRLPRRPPDGFGGARRCHELVSNRRILLDDRPIDIDVRSARYVATDEMRFLSSVTLSINKIERRCSSLNSRWLRH
jgi:hypothetical protein